ncbi:class I SAM-dependent methyltransferase [Sphingobium subterraneum]|uniref:SAM-dependent methyltransferase n=1 Tax=Sphingobium subterraneum TaxID=627688 RepID=A0A841J253_9SPHN|nr:class I SAM-dependent methyltransferase [Sphingobium subterraneum]MBB6125033.1 SAM-dependent methyltransferase [Sphingobium subterraneum]
MNRKLRLSPNFSLHQSVDGRSFVMGEVEPYAQFWLSDRERLLFGLFGRRGGALESDVAEALMRLMLPANSAAERRRIFRTIADMIEAGVLIEAQGEVSRYGRQMARAYLEHRPFPKAVANRIVALAQAGRETRVLDLASGPGSLALELAATSPRVTSMELSRGFVAAAKQEARRRGLNLNALNENCNHLPHHDGDYDAITISQAIHWLDDVALCKGVCRVLAQGGSFFVVHGALTLPEEHPLSYILGDRTPLGDKQSGAFSDEVLALYRRLSLLFEALDTPNVARHDPTHARRDVDRIAGARIELFRQQRPIGEGFARAFLSERHIAVLGEEKDRFWRDLKARCDAATPDQLIGVQEWGLLHFKRGAARFDANTWRRDMKEIAFP